MSEQLPPMGYEPPGPKLTPMRSIWEREPVRVIAAIFLVVSGVNALLLGLNAYDGGAAAAITGFIAVVSTAVNELFTRAEVVPLKPLNDLAEAQRDGPGPAPGPGT